MEFNRNTVVVIGDEKDTVMRIVSFKLPVDENGTVTVSIDGIEKTSLVDFIFKYNGLPYKELHETFWINPKEYKKLWDNLEKNWILIRWENNARILKENIEKSVVENLLNCWNSDDIFPLLYQNKNQIKVWL